MKLMLYWQQLSLGLCLCPLSPSQRSLADISCPHWRFPESLPEDDLWLPGDGGQMWGTLDPARELIPGSNLQPVRDGRRWKTLQLPCSLLGQFWGVFYKLSPGFPSRTDPWLPTAVTCSLTHPFLPSLPSWCQEASPSELQGNELSQQPKWA